MKLSYSLTLILLSVPTLTTTGWSEATQNQAPAPAAPNNQNREWAEKLRSKLAKLEKRKEPVAVASIRGAQKESKSSELYWKKSGRQAPLNDKELEAFNAALKTLEERKNTEAAAAFESFLASYPGSQLAADAKSTLDMLKGSARADNTAPSPSQAH